MQPIADNIQKRINYAREFQDTFGVRLANFFDNLTGFDSVKFDNEFICPPNGVSCSEETIRKFGRPAEALIRKLIGF